VNITDVQDEIAGKISAAAIRVLAWDADAVNPPAVLFELPEDYDYDLTFGRGSDEFTLPIVALVGKTDARSARKALGFYIDGSGPKSLKSIVDSSNTNTYTSCDTVRVRKASDIGPYRVGAVLYLGATFETRITGPGS
jgi:hypothetical protein